MFLNSKLWEAKVLTKKDDNHSIHEPRNVAILSEVYMYFPMEM